MNCRAAEEMVTGYIAHTLSMKELEEFLEHVQHCSSCYEELETYFIVHAAMMQLNDEEESAVLDLQNLLDQDLKKSRRYIRRKKLEHVLTAVLFFIMIAALLACLLFVIQKLGQFL